MTKIVNPPRLADRLLEWYCSNARIEDLHGDIEELFHQDCERMSLWRARMQYWNYVLSLLFSYAIVKRKQKTSNLPYATPSFSPAMFRNYFTIASRNLVKHKFFTIINVLGLAIGMSISLLLIAMLSFLRTYDTFHTNKHRIYRVITKTDDKHRYIEYASAPGMIADKLENELTGIDAVVRINAKLSGNLTYENKEIPVQGYFVDNNFLEVFSFPLLKGNSATAFEKHNSLLITEKTATKLFGNEDPIGKVVEIEGMGIVEISGLLQNPPKNSHMQFDAVASHHFYQALERDNMFGPRAGDPWEYRNSYVYLLLPEKTTLSKVEDFLNSIPPPLYSKKENFAVTFELQSMLSIAPGRELYDQIGPDWGYASLGIFVFLTLLILLPACFNYANISISRALKRMKEIGLRKAMGGLRHQIFAQFITETIIITLIALFFSFYIFILIRGEFLNMLVSPEGLDLNVTYVTIIGFIGFALFVGFVAGVIPATYFSKMNPIQALKTKPVGRGFAIFNFRKVLIVGQFALSLGFIMGVVVVMNQYRYSLNYDFGFNQENILDVELQEADAQLLKNEFSKISAVQGISLSSGIMGTSSTGTTWVKNEHSDSVETAQFFVDDQYIPMMNLSLIAGKNFPDDSVSRRYVVVNEAFLKSFNVADMEAAINQTYTITGSDVTVIGVLKNFHYADLRAPIQSFFFRYDPDRANYANVKVASDDMAATLADMESAWKKIGEENKFTARFLDDEIKDAYSFYFAVIKICGFLGFLAISISCLGLLGMVVFTVENRMKEVGVRKVMGATTLNITLVLSMDFIKLMVIAALIAIPLAYLFFDKIYLQSQASYHLEIGSLEIIVSLFVMLFLGLTTILSQTIKAAKGNPVDTLRYE